MILNIQNNSGFLPFYNTSLNPSLEISDEPNIKWYKKTLIINS